MLCYVVVVVYSRTKRARERLSVSPWNHPFLPLFTRTPSPKRNTWRHKIIYYDVRPTLVRFAVNVPRTRIHKEPVASKWSSFTAQLLRYWWSTRVDQSNEHSRLLLLTASVKTHLSPTKNNNNSFSDCSIRMSLISSLSAADCQHKTRHWVK